MIHQRGVVDDGTAMTEAGEAFHLQRLMHRFGAKELPGMDGGAEACFMRDLIGTCEILGREVALIPRKAKACDHVMRLFQGDLRHLFHRLWPIMADA